MTETNTTLAPCPFCGHDAPEFERKGTGRQSCIVACGNCGCRHESSDEGDLSGSSWNSRESQPASSEPVALPAGMPEPFAFITEKSAAQLLNPLLCLVLHQVCLRRTAQDLGAIAIYTAAQVQAMLAQGLAPLTDEQHDEIWERLKYQGEEGCW